MSARGEQVSRSESGSVSRIMRREEMTALQRGIGARSWMLVDKEIGSEAFTGGMSTFDPGVQVPFHSHNTDEMVTVLEGSGECEIDGVTRPVKPFDTTYIPAGIVHCFRNTGGEPMSILWIYGSVNVTRTFAETGETVQHFSPADRVGR